MKQPLPEAGDEQNSPRTVPCPGCGLLRAIELMEEHACPVCSENEANCAEPPVPAPVPTPAEPSIVPVQAQRSRIWPLLCFLAGVAVGIGGMLAWHSGRDSGRDAEVADQPIAAAASPASPGPVPTEPTVATPQPVPPPTSKSDPPTTFKTEQLPKEFRSPGVGMVMVLIEAGEFKMGSWELEKNRSHDETEHRVRITRPYYIGIYEVTQGEYEKVMNANPSWHTNTPTNPDFVPGKITAHFPVERVTWYDAVAFCNQLSERDGFKPYYQIDNVERENHSIKSAKVTTRGGTGYRLPTEAEWEFACKAGTKTPFHFGSENTGEEANVKAGSVTVGYGSSPKWKDLGRTTTVGSYLPNRWGLYDMHGNAAEWCEDMYGRDYYLKSPIDDPMGPDEGHHRIVRGGSWLLPERSSRSSSRFWLTPDDHKSYLGFRVVRSIEK